PAHGDGGTGHARQLLHPLGRALYLQARPRRRRTTGDPPRQHVQLRQPGEGRSLLEEAVGANREAPGGWEERQAALPECLNPKASPGPKHSSATKIPRPASRASSSPARTFKSRALRLV